MKLSNRVYDCLKWLCMLCLPALAVFLRIFCNIWAIEYGDKIADTIVAVNALLAACLGISTIQYNKDKEE